MKLVQNLRRFAPDPYIAAIVGMVVLASILPCRGNAADYLKIVTNFAIALLFFLYGIRISPQAIWEGISHWRLQALVFGFTFVVFPAIGLLLAHLARPWLGAQMATGVVFLSLLPSTVQSSIVFTSIARGNVAAALCAASLSNLVGMLLTPILVALILGLRGGAGGQGLKDILEQLFLPFAAGQLLRPWLAALLGRHRFVVGLVDRSSILLVVYSAFSESVVGGLWHQVGVVSLAVLVAVNIFLLGAVMASTMLLSRVFGFSREDRIAIVFCGSKKSLASGVPMANILFPAASVGPIVLPLMLFHQIQLMACAALAKSYASEKPN